MAKALPGSQSNYLLPDDIDFIVKNLRYPMRSFKRVFPFVFFLVVLVLTVSIIYFLFHESGNDLVVREITGPLFIFSFSFLFMVFGMINYWRSLFFKRLPAQIDQTENINILQLFIQSEGLRTYHPLNKPEVFLLRSTDNPRVKETEVVIFIAIDKAILVNSHIATSNIFPKSKRRFAELVEKLQVFIQSREIGVSRTDYNFS